MRQKVIIYIRRIFELMRKHLPWLNFLVDKLERKAHLKGKKVQKYQYVGLWLFVAIPLPGTGALASRPGNGRSSNPNSQHPTSVSPKIQTTASTTSQREPIQQHLRDILCANQLNCPGKQVDSHMGQGQHDAWG